MDFASDLCRFRANGAVHPVLEAMCMLWLRFAPAARASKGRRDQGKGTRSTPSAVSVRDGRDRDAGRAPLERREKGLGTSLVSISAPFTQRESLCSKGCPGLGLMASCSKCVSNRQGCHCQLAASGGGGALHACTGGQRARVSWGPSRAQHLEGAAASMHARAPTACARGCACATGA